MHYHLITFALHFLLLVFTYILHAQVPEVLAKAREDVNILCSEEFAGRGYVDSGAVKAAHFLAEEFEKMGLKSLEERSVNTASYLFTFPLKVNVVKDAELVINEKKLSLGTDFITSRLSGSGEVNGNIVDAGYGLSDTLVDATGQTLLVRDGFPEAIASNDSLKALYRDKQRIWDRLTPYLQNRPTAILILQEKLTAGFSLDPYPFPILEIQQDSFPSDFESVSLRVDGGVEILTSYNVLGYVPGSQYQDSFIVITAHYDHLGRIGTAIFPGANDNASGTAMLLSMARYFSKPANRLPYSILFIAFGGEETGLQGSRYFVTEDPIIPLSQMKFLLNLDLMGNGTKGMMTVGGRDYPEYYESLKALNERMEAVPVVSARPNAPNSDHYFFLEAGVPGFFVFSMGGPPHYHDVNDNPENLLLSKFVEIRELLIGFLESF